MFSRRSPQPPWALALLALLACACGRGDEGPAPLSDAGVIVSGEFTTTPGTFAVAGESYLYPARAWQELELAPTYSLVDAPTGMSIDPSTGDVSWIPQTSQGGPHDVAIVATADSGTTEQSYLLEVAVPTLLVQGEIGPEGGALDAPAHDLRLVFPAGAVEAPTAFSLWALSEANPPLWGGMNLLSMPFTLRTDTGISHVDVSIEFRPSNARPGAEVFIARDTYDVDHWGSDNTVIVIDQTKAGPSADQIVADLSGLDALAVPSGWFAVVDLIAVVYPGDEFTVTWIDSGGDEISAVPEQAQIIHAGLEEHKGNAQAIMDCKVPTEKVNVYVADFGPKRASAAAFAANGRIYVPKRALKKPSDTFQHVLAHEYFHVVQAHMAGKSIAAMAARIKAGPKGIGPWWWREATAEFAATRLINKYNEYFAADYSVAAEGLADLKDDSSHKYRLNLYFRYLFETKGMKVCDFMRAQKALLIDDAPIEALSAQLGAEAFVQTFLKFAEAMFFFPTIDNFGKNHQAISAGGVTTLSFASGTASFSAPEFRGAYGIEVNRTSPEAQTLLVALKGPFVASEESAPQIRITDASGDKLATTQDLLFTSAGDSASIALPQVSLSKFFVTISQGEMQEHGSIQDLDLSVGAMALEVATSGSETDEDGAKVDVVVFLTADPGGRSVVVNVSSLDTSEGTVDKNQIVFDENYPWNVPQHITVTGQLDKIDDPATAYQVRLEVSEPADWKVKPHFLDLVNLPSACPQLSKYVGYQWSDVTGTESFTATADGNALSFSMDHSTSDTRSTSLTDYLPAKVAAESTYSKEHHTSDQSYRTGPLAGLRNGSNSVEISHIVAGTFSSPWGVVAEDILAETKTDNAQWTAATNSSTMQYAESRKILTRLTYGRNDQGQGCKILFEYYVFEQSGQAAGDAQGNLDGLYSLTTSTKNVSVSYIDGVRSTEEVLVSETVQDVSMRVSVGLTLGSQIGPITYNDGTHSGQALSSIRLFGQ